MDLIILQRTPRENAMVEYLLSTGARRYTVNVTEALDQSPTLDVTLAQIVETLARQADVNEGIVTANQKV